MVSQTMQNRMLSEFRQQLNTISFARIVKLTLQQYLVLKFSIIVCIQNSNSTRN